MEVFNDDEFTHLLVSLDGRRAMISLSNCSQYRIIKTFESRAFKAHKKGGQSQARFNRGRKEVLKNYMNDLMAYIRTYKNMNIIIGGSGQIKKQLIHRMNLVKCYDSPFGGSVEGIEFLRQYQC